MKITNQLIRSRASRPVHSVEFLDLSHLEIDTIEKIGSCPKLVTLILRGNRIGIVANLERSYQLWNVDLGNNRIRLLTGFRRFIAFGTLVLSNNDISWEELEKIRHIHILNLSLHGNPQLEKDPNYRKHVIDCLPRVWMLDGRIVTSTERLQVKHFFQDRALSEHPIRHKLGRIKFTPTILKRIEVTGIFGERCIKFMKTFPVDGSLNIDTDRRRIQYLAYNFQEDLYLENHESTSRSYGVVAENRSFMEALLKNRIQDDEQTNMLLLLLVASLEFAIPANLMKETLYMAQLIDIQNVFTMNLFLLPREIRCQVVCILLSAIKVDKDIGLDGGLYDKLYLGLYYSASELTRVSQTLGEGGDNLKRKQAHMIFKESRSLIAAEVVQLMCIVPVFFEYISKDPGVMHLVTTATGDLSIIEKIGKLVKKMEKDEQPTQKICEQVADLIQKIINEEQNLPQNVKTALTEKKSETDYVLKTFTRGLPRKSSDIPMNRAEKISFGRASPDRRQKIVKTDGKGIIIDPPPIPMANLGEQVLIGPQNLARIISIPEPHIILVQMYTVPSPSGAMIISKDRAEHYSFIDVRDLVWDQYNGYWRPKGTVGDRITIQEQEENLTTASVNLQDKSDSSEKRKQSTTPIAEGDKESAGSRPVSAKLKDKYDLKLDVTATISRIPLGDHLQNSVQSVRMENQKMHWRSKSAHPDSRAHREPLSIGMLEEEKSIIRPLTAHGETSYDSQDQDTEFGSAQLDELHMSMHTEESDTHTRTTPIEIPQIGKDDTISQDKLPETESQVKVEEPPPRKRLIHKDTPIPKLYQDTYKVLVSKEGPIFGSPYQGKRTQAWANASGSGSPPLMSQRDKYAGSPVRPCSPGLAKKLGHPPMKIKTSTKWLAGGRDLHWEERQRRPKPAQPGWKEGLPQRDPPESAKRARQRTVEPRPISPSSMTYDQIYGKGPHHAQPYLPEYGMKSPFDTQPTPNVISLDAERELIQHLAGKLKETPKINDPTELIKELFGDILSDTSDLGRPMDIPRKPSSSVQSKMETIQSEGEIELETTEQISMSKDREKDIPETLDKVANILVAVEDEQLQREEYGFDFDLIEEKDEEEEEEELQKASPVQDGKGEVIVTVPSSEAVLEIPDETDEPPGELEGAPPPPPSLTSPGERAGSEAESNDIIINKDLDGITVKSKLILQESDNENDELEVGSFRAMNAIGEYFETSPSNENFVEEDPIERVEPQFRNALSPTQEIVETSEVIEETYVTEEITEETNA